MKKWLKEPLVHFVVLGFLIFGFYSITNQNTEDENSIVIDDAEYDYLLSFWKKQWNREPTEKDIKAFLDQHLRQEVFYKEALALNLDHNDIIVKRRLSQKMEAVSNDLSSMMSPPTDEELKKFFNEHPQLFTIPTIYSFQQVLFLDNEPNLNSKLSETKKSLANNQSIPSERKLKLSIQNEWNQKEASDIDNALGKEFSAQLDSLPLNQWVGPVSSGFGQHLVYIKERNKAKNINFEDIRPYVEKEFEYYTELEMQEKVYRELLKKYNLKITSSKVPNSVKKSYQN